MATNVLATSSQTSSPLGGILSLDKGDLEEVANEKGGDFLSMMLEAISGEEDSKSSKTAILNSLIANNGDTEDLKGFDISSLDESLESLQLEEATFVQILQFLEHLNGGEEVKTLPKLDSKLNQLLQDASIVEEFKGANSLKDVLELSKKYDLGLEKISITKSDVAALKESFPNLESKGFFKELQSNITSQDILKTSKQQTLQIAQESKSEKIIQQPTQTLTNILQNISKDSKSEKSTLQDILKSTDKTKTEDDTKTVKTVDVKDIKTDEPKIATSKVEKSTKAEDLQTLKEIKTVDFKDETKIKNTLDETTKEAQKLQNTDRIIPTDTLNKEANTQQNEIKSQKTQAQDIKIETTAENKSDNKSETSEQNQKQDSSHTAFAKEIGKTNNLNIKSSNFRQTLNTFAQEFKEKVEEYKPPIMKVTMALNPKNLGEMDVTIVNRGNNLQVNITSNTSAMNLFLQNQAEFKNSLVNMGFTNLEMNFSNQRQNSGQNQNGTRYASHSNEEEEYEEYATESTVLEMVIPDYV